MNVMTDHLLFSFLLRNVLIVRGTLEKSIPGALWRNRFLFSFLLRNVLTVRSTCLTEKSIPGDEETSEGMQVWEEQRETGSQAKKDACA